MLIWLLADQEPRKHAAFKGMLARYSAERPGVQASFAVKTFAGLWESLFRHLRDPRSNPMADIVEVPATWAGVFSRLGLLAEMESGFESYSPAKLPDFLRGEGADQQAYFAPVWAELPCLHVRSDAAGEWLDRQGRSLASWDDFRAFCAWAGPKWRRKGRFAVLPFSHNGAFAWSDAMNCVWSRGGDVFTEDFTRTEISRSETVEGVEDLLGLAIEGHAPVFSRDAARGAAVSDPDASSFFWGRTPGHLRARRGGGFRVFPWPGAASRGGDLLLVRGLALSAGSQKREEAAAFLKWFWTPANVSAYCSAFGAWPCLKQPLEEALEESRSEARFRELFSRARLEPRITAYPSCEFLLDRVLWNASARIAREAYSRDDLTRELILIQSEIEYLLSLY